MLYYNILASKTAKKDAIESARKYLMDSLVGVNAIKKSTTVLRVSRFGILDSKT